MKNAILSRTKAALHEHSYAIQKILAHDTSSRLNGIASDGKGNRYFFKSALGTGSYAYHSLLREGHVTSHISDLTSKHPVTYGKFRLFIPHVREIIRKRGLLIVVTEFAYGTPLSQLSVLRQTELLITASALIASMPKFTSNEYMGHFVHYSRHRLLIQLPFRLLKAIYLHPFESMLLIQLFAHSVRALFHSRNESYGIIHPDLNSTNVIVQGKTIFVTDWEEAAFGNVLFTLTTPVCLAKNKSRFLSTLKKTYSRKDYDSISAYIWIKIIMLCNQNVSSKDYRFARDIQILRFFLYQRKSLL